MISETSKCGCLGKEDYPGFQHRMIWKRDFYPAIDSMVGENIELVCTDILYNKDIPSEDRSMYYKDFFTSLDAVRSSSGSVFIFCDADRAISDEIKSYANDYFGADSCLEDTLWRHNLRTALDPYGPDKGSRWHRVEDRILHYCTDLSAKGKFEKGWLHTEDRDYTSDSEDEVFKKIISKGSSEKGKVLIVTHDSFAFCIQADKSKRQWMSISGTFPFSHEMRMRFYSEKVRFRLLGEQKTISDNADTANNQTHMALPTSE